MYRRYSVNFALLSMALDALAVCTALILATNLRPLLGFLPFAAPFPEVIPTPWVVYLVFSMEWIAINALFSVYDGRRNLRGVDEFTRLTLASLLAMVALAGTLYLSYRQVSRLLFGAFIIITYLAMLAWRALARWILTYNLARPENQRRVLIVGAGPVGYKLYEQILGNSHLGLKVIGFLDDNPSKRNARLQILGDLASATQVIQERKIDDVVIALPQQAYRRTNHLIGELHRLPVKVWVIPDYFRMTLHKAAIEEFADIPMLDLRAPALSDTQRLVKRAFDLVITSLLMIFILPLMGLIALAIRLEGPGTIIFRQLRAGENGRIFGMYKFRTMVPNADELRPMVEKTDAQGHLIHKTADDPRVTRVGRFLRRMSLDEFPQFFNILKGEMSLVGPRPELPYLVDRYEDWQRQRFAVPQGLTGWWQINGRSDKPMHLNTEDDLYYIQNYSLLLDLYIVLKTPGVILSGKGAF